MTPSRRAALLRLLEDWEAGGMTETRTLEYGEWVAACRLAGELHAAQSPDRELLTLTPAGIAAARAVKEEGS